MPHHRQRGFAASRAFLLGGLAAASVSAQADDLTISSTVTSPVATATAANGSPGNITVASGGSVIVGSGVAATVNSNNTLNNSGATIANSAASGATAVIFDGTNGITAGLVNTGAINAGASSGSGNAGVLVSGGPVSGTISLARGGTVTVAGANSFGVSIASPLTGNLDMRGTISTVDAGATSVSVTAPITGAIINAGAITSGTAATVDSKNNVVPAVSALASLQVASSVTGGVLNDRYYIDANGAIVPTASVDTTVDTLVTGAISTIGSGPAVLFAPTGPTAITLGAVGTGDDAYAVVNRGSISAGAGSAGMATTAIRIGGGGATTTLVGGINSQANATVTAAALDAQTVAVDLQAGAVVPQLKNQGTMTATTTLTAAANNKAAGPGGSAYGVLIEAGASLPSLVNSGTLTATAVGAGTSGVAIADRSGTLASIVNSGTITATSAGANGIARAIDLTGSAANVTLTNSGTITGAVDLGNGSNTVNLTGGALNGTLALGAGSNQLSMSGASTLASQITSPGPLAVTLADTAKLDVSKSTLTLSSISASGSSLIAVPVGTGGTALNVSGAASFTGNSVVQLSLQSLNASQNLTVVRAAGGVSTDHLATLVDASISPYLFTASTPTMTATTIDITLARKTADQIGLTGNRAALFNQSLTALTAGSAETSAIANLPDQASVVAAYNQIAPPSAGRAPLRVAESISAGGFGATADRLQIVEDIHHNGGGGNIGLWAQELGDFASQSAGVNEMAYHTDGFGIIAGIDAQLLGPAVAGVALVLDGTTIHQSQGAGLPEIKVKATTTGIQPYLSWNWKALFVQATGLAAHVSYGNDRTLSIGTLADSVSSDWKGTQLAAGLTLGARLDFGRLRITPSNTLSWTRLTQDAYTEEGGGPLAMSVAKQTDTAKFDTSRLSIAYRIPVTDGGFLKIEGHGAYMHQFNSTPTETIATFAGGGAAVTLLGDAVGDNETSYGGAIGFEQDGMAAKFGYDRRQASSFHDQSFAATVGVSF